MFLKVNIRLQVVSVVSVFTSFVGKFDFFNTKKGQKVVYIRQGKVRDFDVSGEICEFYKRVSSQEYTAKYSAKFVVLDGGFQLCVSLVMCKLSKKTS